MRRPLATSGAAICFNSWPTIWRRAGTKPGPEGHRDDVRTAQAPGMFVVRDMLTPEEIERLRRSAKETSAYYRERFGSLRTAAEKKD